MKYNNSDEQCGISLESKVGAFKFGEDASSNIHFQLDITLHEDSRGRKTVDEIEFFNDCWISNSDEDGDGVSLFEDDMMGNLPAAKKFYQKFLSKLQEYEKEELQRVKSNS